MVKCFIKYSCFVLLFLSSASCNGVDAPTSNSPVPSHELWDQLLKKYVNEDGRVNYKGFKKDEEKLKEYLSILSKSAPDPASWSNDDRLAYWINAYNAFTIALILENYPVKSIKDIGSGPLITFVNSPWDIKFIEIGDEKYDLNNIEHGIIRKDFNDPRIHFALVCAAKSCPELRKEAYTGARLNKQLEEEAIAFINDPVRNRISKDKAVVSKYFTWYAGDFKQNGKSVIDYLNQYAKIKINPDAELDFLEYDWSLNER